MDLLANNTGLEWVSPLVTLATSGGFAALVWYLVVKHIPAIEDRHQTERGEWRAYMESRDARFEEIIKEFRETINEHRVAIEAVKNELSQLQ